MLPFPVDLPFPHRVNPRRLNGSKDVINCFRRTMLRCFSVYTDTDNAVMDMKTNLTVSMLNAKQMNWRFLMLKWFQAKHATLVLITSE
ncbi:hypothetical protein RYX36_024998, partial [Vicia faba]